MVTTTTGAPPISTNRRDAGSLRTSSFPTAGRGARRRQLPWIGVGVLLVAMSMLGFSLWSVQQSARTPVLVAGRELAPGDVIQRSDIVLVNVGADAGLTVAGADEEASIVGRVARGPIPVGTPLSSALVVAPSEAVPSGRAVVGTLLEPGQYPAGNLRAGDRVRLIRTSASSSATGDVASSLTVGEATIWAIEPVVEGRRELFVSLLVDERAAETVADVAAADRLRLVLLGSN